MKFKKLLGGGLLATVLALGVGAGLTVHSESKVADAGGGVMESHRVYVAVYNSILNNYSNPKVRVNSNTGGSGWRNEFATCLNDTTTYTGYTVYSGHYFEDYGGVDNLQFQIFDGDTQKEQHQPIGSWTTTSYEDKVYFYADSSIDPKGGTWDDSYDPVTPIVYRTVSKYAVVDGTPEANPFSQDATVVDGSVYEVPAGVVRTGYHFGGWYTTSACSAGSEYTARTVNADMSIFAKYTTITVDSYIYWVDKDSGDLAPGRVYFFGEYANSWDEGPLLSSYEVSGGALNLNNEGHLYKIPVPSIGDYQVVLHNGNVQTVNMTITPRSIYYTSHYYDYDSKYYYNYSAGNDAMAAAADFLVAAETKRNAATYKTLGYSVCGISKPDAASLINTYDKVLDDESRGYVNKSFTYTYNPAKSANEQLPLDPKDQINVTYDLIVAKLREIADGTEPNLNTRSISLFGDIDNSTPIMLVVIISVVSLTAVGGYIFLKRRKEN